MTRRRYSEIVAVPPPEEEGAKQHIGAIRMLLQGGNPLSALKRSLPVGRQWLGYDKPGGRACQRRLRQMARGVDL